MVELFLHEHTHISKKQVGPTRETWNLLSLSSLPEAAHKEIFSNSLDRIKHRIIQNMFFNRV